MNVHRYPSRTAGAIAAAVLLVCTSTPADASTTANATSASQAASSGTWGAVATQSAAPYNPSPVLLKLTFQNNGNSQNPLFTPQFFTVGNTGTLPITAASYITSTVAQASVQFIVESCSTTWDEPNGICTGGTVAQVLATKFGSNSATTPGPAPAIPGSNLRLRARVATNGNVTPNNYSPALTISTNVDRTQVRNATTTDG